MAAARPAPVPRRQQKAERELEDLQLVVKARNGDNAAMDQLIRRLLGIELKMKQYAEGSAFVRTVVGQKGIAGFNQVWSSPEIQDDLKTFINLPSHAEITAPDRWISRVLDRGQLPTPN